MEEFVGKLWDRWLTHTLSAGYPKSSVVLEDIKNKLSLWFHAFGGDPALGIRSASQESWNHNKHWLARVSGINHSVQLAWKDEQDIYLPGTIDYFPDRQLNESLYLWLAAMISNDDDFCDDWLAASQQKAVSVLAQWPGLKNTYQRLVQAHLLQRQKLPNSSLAKQEQYIIQALLKPGSVKNTNLTFEPKKFAPVPIWLHPFPPESQTTDKMPSADNMAITNEVEEVESDHRRKARRVNHSKEDEGLLAFRLESLFSWAEFVNVDRPQEDDEELGAKEAANDLDEFAVSRKGSNVKQRLKFDLDLPTLEYDDAQLSEDISLPEWNYRSQTMQPNHCTLTLMVHRQVTATSLPNHLRHQARQVRAFFEYLALNKQWQRMQPQGSEIDWDAHLTALTSSRLGYHEATPGLYREVRRHQRDMSCLLLADLSLSTESAIDNEHAIIDVIRDALFLMSESLEATDDRFAIAGFSSKNRQHVRYYPLKNFDQQLSDQIRGHIQSIRPGLYTRMGAAIRYATQQLQHESTSHRLLILLSDGKPNDVDRYEGRYGIEDTRQAILESQRHGIIPFCVTVDKEANKYLPYLFGLQKFAVINDAKQLPAKLPLIYAQLTQAI
jgi:nitric oxide reductase NorD protein